MDNFPVTKKGSFLKWQSPVRKFCFHRSKKKKKWSFLSIIRRKNLSFSWRVPVFDRFVSSLIVLFYLVIIGWFVHSLIWKLVAKHYSINMNEQTIYYSRIKRTHTSELFLRHVYFLIQHSGKKTTLLAAYCLTNVSCSTHSHLNITLFASWADRIHYELNGQLTSNQ